MRADLLGVVLCGGESRRMGRDKGLLLADGVPWAVRIGEKLAPWDIPVVYSINGRQLETYAAVLPPGSWVVDSFGLAGPLEGLFSVHGQFPQRDLLLLACDMIDLDTATIQTLLDAYLDDGGNGDFFVFSEESAGPARLQPFCGIYSARALHRLRGAYLEGPRTDLSLRGLLNNGRMQRLAIGTPMAFRNYNSL